VASVRHLEFGKFRSFVKWSSSEWKFASAYQIWLKSVNSRLRYGDKAIFKMAAVRYLKFAKIAVLITSPVSACDSSFSIRNTRFHRNRINQGWDMLIKLFSKWRPSAILNLRKLPSRSRDPYLHVILHLYSEFRINWPIWRRDIAKKRFSIWRPSAILNWLWRHHIASENCILCSQLRVKFSRRSVTYFLKYLVFHDSAFWLEIAYFGLNFDDFLVKIGKNAKIKYSNPKRHILGTKHVY